MATVTVTPANWNDPAFWSGLSVSDGDSLDLSALGSGYTLTFAGSSDAMTINDGSTSFTVVGSPSGGGDAQLGNGRIWNFDHIDMPDGDSSYAGGAGVQSIQGGDGDDAIYSGGDSDTIDGGAGDDTIHAGDAGDIVDGGAGSDTINGGRGTDTITGGDGDDTFVYTAGDRADTITDFNTGNSGALGDGDTTNNDFIDLSAFYTNLSELRADFDDDGVLNQSNDGVGSANYSDNTQFAAGDSLTFSGASRSSFTSDNTGVICFAAETLIQTPRGQVPIGDIKIGDQVDTLDNGPQRVRWVGWRNVNGVELLANPRLLPIRIKPGVLGNERALVVSRQHGILLGGHGTHLIRAAKLLNCMDGIHVAGGRTDVSYIHIMFDRHQIVLAGGVPAESFYPGKMAVSMMDHAARSSFESCFGPLAGLHTDADTVTSAFGPMARPFRVKF